MNKPKTANCHYCGRDLVRSYITKDHIVAKINGGDSQRNNLVWADQVCNMIKSDSQYDDFRAWIASLNEAQLEDLRTAPLDVIDWKRVQKYQRHFHKMFPPIVRTSEEVVQRKVAAQLVREEKKKRHEETMASHKAKKDAKMWISNL